MNLTNRRLQQLAAETGFRPQILEKALRLVHLRDALNDHPFLGNRSALKAGTALNAFLFRLRDSRRILTSTTSARSTPITEPLIVEISLTHPASEGLS